MFKFATLFIGAVSAGIPTAMFHGFGDFCLQPGDGQFDKTIAKGTNSKCHCIDVGIPAVGEVVNNLEHVANVTCTKVAAHKDFQGDFNVIGLSQGGLLARYIVESCKMPGTVKKMVTIGGPHMGVDMIPHCFSGVVCDMVNDIARALVYESEVQDLLVPAGYFRNPANLDAYKKGSVFLPALNNEIEQQSDAAIARKQRFSALDGAFLAMFSNDTMISPKETAWFQPHDKDFKTVLAINETDFYNQDFIGFKALDDAGKVKRVAWDGDHLQFTEKQINEQIIPFLNA